MAISRRLVYPGVLALAAICTLTSTAKADLVLVDPGTLSSAEVITFEDLELANNESQTFDSVFESGNALFGERFSGQALTTSGDFDILSGTPSGPLSIAVGDTGQNITAIDGGAGDVGNTSIAGSGPLGFPAADAVGEGSIAVLYDFDQSEFGFDIFGPNGGTATAQFWARDGSLVDEIVFDLGTGVSESFGFQTSDSSNVVAGVSIFNDDLGGVGFDNLISDVPGVVGPPPNGGGIPPVDPPAVDVPEPSAILLLGAALLVLGLSRRHSG